MSVKHRFVCRQACQVGEEIVNERVGIVVYSHWLMMKRHCGKCIRREFRITKIFNGIKE